MKKKMIKIGLAALLLLTMLATAVTASAEDNGYWTSTTDASGNSVMVYTYTEPVEWTVNEQSGYGSCGNTNPGVVSQNTPNNSALAAEPAASAQAPANTADAVVKTNVYIAWNILLPVLASVLGAAAMAIVIKKAMRRRAPATVRLT